jgi:hypothetical protein
MPRHLWTAPGALDSPKALKILATLEDLKSLGCRKSSRDVQGCNEARVFTGQIWKQRNIFGIPGNSSGRFSKIVDSS